MLPGLPRYSAVRIPFPASHAEGRGGGAGDVVGSCEINHEHLVFHALRQSLMRTPRPFLVPHQLAHDLPNTKVYKCGVKSPKLLRSHCVSAPSSILRLELSNAGVEITRLSRTKRGTAASSAVETALFGGWMQAKRCFRSTFYWL